MTWTQIRFNTRKEHSDAISDALLAQGALSITYLDAKDEPVLEPLPGEFRLWSQLIICALFDEQAALDRALIMLKTRTEISPHIQALKVEIVEDKDWQNTWKDNYHPIKIANNLWICPSWRPVVDEHATNILLDPGLAFGTGTHATTFLCLEWLAGQALANKRIIDYGCGSGILAIAAQLLNAAEVMAIDIDPQAIEATEANCARNGIAEGTIPAYLSQQAPDRDCDILLANILAGPLKELGPDLAGRLVSGGEIVLSGILESQIPDILSTYNQWFIMSPPTIKDGWARLTGTKVR